MPRVAKAKKAKKERKHDIQKRWTPRLAESFTPVAEAFLKYYSVLDPPITTAEAMFVIHVIAHKWTGKAPFPAFKTIAKRMGVTDAQTRNHARSLARKGYLRRVFRVGTTNLFYFEGLFQALENHLEVVEKAETDEDDED